MKKHAGFKLFQIWGDVKRALCVYPEHYTLVDSFRTGKRFWIELGAPLGQ